MENTNNKTLFGTFLSYSIPCILGMFLTSFIIIVDGIFIGWKIGQNGLATVNLTLPVLYVLMAITIMVGVGGITLGAQSLGEKNHNNANRYFTLAFIINLVVNIIAMIVLRGFLDAIVQLLNAKGILFNYAKDFLGTMSYFYVFMMMNMTFSMFIRSEGKPQLSLVFGIAGNVLNIILDYIFIVRLDMGMKGAAFASGISVILPFLFGIGYFISSKSVYKFTRIRFELDTLRKMVFLGMAEFVAQISVSVTLFLFNFVIFRRIGIQGIAAMTIIGYISVVQNMILTGIAIGIHPLISFHFGAKNREVILNLLTIAIKAVLIVGIVVFVLSMTAAGGIVRMFAKENVELQIIARDGLRLYSIGFLLNGYNIIAAAYFTSLGNAKEAAIISTLRSLLLVSAFIFVLPYVIGVIGIWLTVPLTEAVTFGVAYLYIKKSRTGLSFEVPRGQFL